MRTEGRGQRKLGAFGYLGDAAHRFQQGYRTRTVFPVSGPAPDFLTSVAELPFGGAAGGLKFANPARLGERHGVLPHNFSITLFPACFMCMR